MTTLTYAEVGATRREPLPRHYNHLRFRTRVGEGPEVFARAAEAILTFRMHRSAGARVRSAADRAAPGVRLTVTLGPFTVPCQVVYVLDSPERAGFGYGSLPGHQERGEEAFTVEMDPQGGVWFRVTAFSRPATWITVVAGPIAVAAQHAFARLLGRTLRRICTVKA
jgi:uncharacterized protein (UPF0548 family)